MELVAAVWNPIGVKLVVRPVWCVAGVSWSGAKSIVGADGRSTAYVPQHDGRLRPPHHCTGQTSTVYDALRGTRM